MSLSAISSTSSAAPVAAPQRAVAANPPAASAPAPKADAVTISPAGHAASSGDGDHDGH